MFSVLLDTMQIYQLTESTHGYELRMIQPDRYSYMSVSDNAASQPATTEIRAWSFLRTTALLILLCDWSTLRSRDY